MKYFGIVIIIFVLGLNSKTPLPRNEKPVHFTMFEEWESATQTELIFTHSIADTLPEVEIFLHSDSLKQPLFFSSEVKTPVCIDGICKPVQIRIFWNLLGNYSGFGLVNKIPLTKYDNEEFDSSDYLKFHQLLLNKKSVLREKKLEDFYDPNIQSDKTIKYKGEEVDGMTGATKKEIKDSVVEGALYSCYTIWHLVHGEISKRIKKHFESILTEDLKKRFLFSKHTDYQYFALKKSDKLFYKNHVLRILEIFKSSPPLLRIYILKKLPDSVLNSDFITRELYQSFSIWDIQTKTLLIKKLSWAHQNATRFLSFQIEKMSKNQLKTYLNFLKENKSALTERVLNNLTKSAKNPEFAFGYLIRNFLIENG